MAKKTSKRASRQTVLAIDIGGSRVKVDEQHGPNQARICVRSRSLRESDGDEGQGADERLVL